ncbi:MAG: ABC transporter ATP-binding protein [Firmicutes bacterium]|nr:ABC transporter ATP-binding protein [Bacillota bacterium]
MAMAGMAEPAAVQEPPMIAARGLTVRLGGGGQPLRTVLEDITLNVPVGAFVSVVGPSGCGKSTLLKAVAGLVPPAAGELEVAGGSPQAAVRARKLGMVFQNPALLAWRTVLANVALPLELKGVPRREREARARAELARMGLAEVARFYPRMLSGGMQSRVSIARALAGDPALLLLDEPFGALDEITRTRLNEELLGLWEQSGMTVLMVTHSLMEAVWLSDRVVVMGPGRILTEETVDLPRPRTAAMRLAPEATEQARRLERWLAEAGRRN